MHWKRPAPDSGRGIHWCDVRHTACHLCFQSLVRCPMSEIRGAQRGTRRRDHLTARAAMRFLLRLLLLLVLSSYLLSHYGFLRDSLWHMHLAGHGQLLNRLPGITKDHPQDGPVQATLPARGAAASRSDARNNESARFSRQYQKYHLSARLHGEHRTAVRVHQRDKTSAHEGLRG